MDKLLRHLAWLLGVALWAAAGFLVIFLLVSVITDPESAPGGLIGGLFAVALLGGLVTLMFGAMASGLISWSEPVVTVHSKAIQYVRSRLGPGVGISDEDWDEIETLEGVDYLEYLNSPQWQERRLLMLERFGRRCQVCNSQSHLNIHHRTYERLGAERLDDLTVLCKDCHDLFHQTRGMPQPE